MPTTTVVTNVRVFDGTRLTEPTTIVLDGDVIGTGSVGAETVDGGGATLLPGLLDAHVHMNDRDELTRPLGR
jgi:dihydroorotase-like cyclic amidohydrolase